MSQMKTTRRSFMRLVGTSAVVLGATSVAGAGVFAMTRTPHKALTPWSEAGGMYEDVRKRALSYAILAPNPHNRQPGLADLTTPNEIALYCDLTRLLPETDPFNRQILIGLGCFLELLQMAARQDGYGLDIERFPQGVPTSNLDERPIARIRFKQAAQLLPDPLFAYVLMRRSNKKEFDTSKPVSIDSLQALQKAAGGHVSVGIENQMTRVARLRALTWRAFETEIRTPKAYAESVKLARIGKEEIEKNPDGIALGGPMLEALNKLGMMTREKMADPNDPAFEQGLEMFRPILKSAMGYVWVATQNNDRLAQLDAGQAWLRINLKATELGLGLHPISQALQEYDEMETLFAELNQMIGIKSPHRVQMLGRVGYGQKVDPSPRWPYEKSIL